MSCRSRETAPSQSRVGAIVSASLEPNLELKPTVCHRLQNAHVALASHGRRRRRQRDQSTAIVTTDHRPFRKASQSVSTRGQSALGTTSDRGRRPGRYVTQRTDLRSKRRACEAGRRDTRRERVSRRARRELRSGSTCSTGARASPLSAYWRETPTS